MSRLIDADALEMVMTQDWFLEILATQGSKSAIKKDIENCIDNIPTAEEYINCSTDTSSNTSSGWIPCSERLPEKNAIVLTCDKDGWISVKVNMPYAGVKNDFECGYYTAWMPLPEPYTPKEGRE